MTGCITTIITEQANDRAANPASPHQGENNRPEMKKALSNQCFFLESWCPGPDSNRHALRRGILRPQRLKIALYINWLKWKLDALQIPCKIIQTWINSFDRA